MGALLRAAWPGADSTRPLPGAPEAGLALACGLLLLACAGGPRALPTTEAVAPPAAPAGDVAVHLVFGAEADLDLFVTDPRHEEIYFANTLSRLGGVFEGDLRCEDPAPRVETIRFSPAPAGRYRVSVDYPKRCDSGGGDVPFRVIVEAGGRRREVDGQARFGKLEHIVLEFDVTGAGASFAD